MAVSAVMRPCVAGGGLMGDWDDDAEYQAAVGRSWLMVAMALACVALLIGVALVGVLGVFGVFEVLSIVSADMHG